MIRYIIFFILLITFLAILNNRSASDFDKNNLKNFIKEEIVDNRENQNNITFENQKDTNVDEKDFNLKSTITEEIIEKNENQNSDISETLNISDDNENNQYINSYDNKCLDDNENTIIDENEDDKDTTLDNTTSHITALILFGDMNDFKDNVEPFEGIDIKNLKIPGNFSVLENRLKNILLCYSLDENLISKLKNEIIKFYQKNCHPIVNVLVPEQEITNGVLQILVIEGKIGNISVKNNKYKKTNRILNSIWLKQDDFLDTSILLNDIAWLNKDPFQNISVMLSPSDKKGYTDIELLVNDRFPLRVYTGGDNTGTEFTGLNRFFAGFNLGDVFYSNHIFSYQYTASFDFRRFWSHTLNYKAFLPWKNTLILFGGYSKTHPSIVGLKNKGKSSQISVRYEIPINKIYKSFQQSFNFGYDYKSSNNNIATVSQSSRVSISQSTDLSQFLLEYQIIYEVKNNKMIVLNDLFFSPILWLDHQTASKYNALHTYADPKYCYYKIFIEDEYTFNNWAINLTLRGQISNKNLLPSEQYYLGGQDTLRGYQNRIVTRDNALNINLELKTPPLKFLFRRKKNIFEELKFHTFLDFGIAKDHKKSFAGNKQALLGTGLGLKYNFENKANVKFDWGIPLFEIPGKNSQQLYLSVIFSL